MSDGGDVDSYSRIKLRYTVPGIEGATLFLRIMKKIGWMKPMINIKRSMGR
jgi:hypothetical protein